MSHREWLWAGLMVIVPLTVKGVALELQTLESPFGYKIVMAVLRFAWLAARWRTKQLAQAETCHRHSTKICPTRS